MANFLRPCKTCEVSALVECRSPAIGSLVWFGSASFLCWFCHDKTQRLGLLAAPESALGDHDVERKSNALDGRRIALLLSGGIACIKIPLLARELRRHGAEVVAMVSEEALRYVTVDALSWCTDRPVICALSAQAEHLSGRSPFDAYLVAPATYNTINKLRYGIADGVLTSVLVTAFGRLERGQSKLLLAPTMHGSMHNSILTESLHWLAEHGVRVIPPSNRTARTTCPRSTCSPTKSAELSAANRPDPVVVRHRRGCCCVRQ